LDLLHRRECEKVSCHNHMTGSHSVTSHNRSHDRNGKVVHRPSSSCISSVENLTGTLLSSFCQMLIKSSWLNSGLELTLWHLPSYVSDSTVNPFQHTRYLSFPLTCYDLAKQLSHYLYFFSFSFLLFSDYCFSFIFSFSLFSYWWMHKRKVTHREAWEKRKG